jgi:hypothetical protein
MDKVIAARGLNPDKGFPEEFRRKILSKTPDDPRAGGFRTGGVQAGVKFRPGLKKALLTRFPA